MGEYDYDFSFDCDYDLSVDYEDDDYTMADCDFYCSLHKPSYKGIDYYDNYLGSEE